MSLKQLLIDGEFVDAAGGETFPTEDPRTGDILLDVAEAQAEDVDRAVKAARKVQPFLQNHAADAHIQNIHRRMDISLPLSAHGARCT